MKIFPKANENTCEGLRNEHDTRVVHQLQTSCFRLGVEPINLGLAGDLHGGLVCVW